MKNDNDYLFYVAGRLKQEYKPSKIVDKVVIMYDNATFIDTNNDDLKRIEITLKIKKWSV